MVKVTLLAAVAAACLAALPAQAQTLSPAATADAALAQVSATTTSVAGTADSAAATAQGSVRPTVARAAATVRAVATATPAAEAPARSLATAAETAADAAGLRPEPAAPAAPAAPVGRAATELGAGAASHDRTARLRSDRSAAARSDARPRRAVAPAGAQPRAAAVAVADAPRAASRASRGDRPGDPSPAPMAGGTASPAPASFYFGGLALLAISLSLAGPRLGRRLLIRPASATPAVFVSALERPG
jgi:hypothetical protein